MVGVAESGWTREQLVERARASVTEHGGLDEAAFAALAAQLRYVDGDYNDPATFAQLRASCGDAERPAALPGDPAQHVPGGRRAPGASRLRRRTRA